MPLQDDFNENADTWFALESGNYPAVPRGDATGVIAVRSLLPLVIEDTQAFRAQENVAEAAMVILSQSPHARALAQVALQKNYSIRFTDALEDSENAERSGSTDHTNRRIIALTQGDPLRVALVIAHELAHVAQAEKGFTFSVLDKTPAAAIRELMALEGDARAHEFIVALELAYKSGDDPDERLLFPQAIDAVMDSTGSALTRKVIEYFRPQFPDIDPDEMMARVFKSFHGSLALRLHYEGTIMTALENLEPQQLRDPALFKDEFDSPATLRKLGDYAQKAAKYLDLDSPQMACITAFTQEQLAAWQHKRDAKPAAPNLKKAPSP